MLNEFEVNRLTSFRPEITRKPIGLRMILGLIEVN